MIPGCSQRRAPVGIPSRFKPWALLIVGSGKYVEQLPDELKLMPGLGLVSADMLVVEIDNP